MASLDSLFVIPLQEVDIKDDASFEELSDVKEKIESNLSLLFDHLTKHRADMDTALVTQEGFPRSDIDVLQVRYTRAKIITNRNDLRKVLQLLDLKLVERLSINNGIRDMQIESVSHTPPQVKSTIPFAIVSEIVDQSPASQAGLKVNDKIIEIGDINVTNHNNLQKLPSLVINNEDKLIKLTILRDDDTIELTLTPTRNWPGQGLLGCKLNLV